MLDEYLKVSADNGEYPVVTALESENLYFLNQRVTAVGGVANIFVDRGDRVSVLYAEDSNGKPSGAVDLSSGWENGDSTVGLFLDYLAMNPDGVIIPQRLEKGPITMMNMKDSVSGLDPKDAHQLDSDELMALC